jgi:hypothetical protein
VPAPICPQCMNPVPATLADAYSDGLDCPNCKTRLEVSTLSRMPAALAGVLAGWVVYRITSGGTGPLDAMLPELYSILAFGAVSALVLMFSAGLELAPPAPVAVPASHAADHGHGGSHH